jgi:DNA-binding MarR family transcriptional regulator
VEYSTVAANSVVLALHRATHDTLHRLAVDLVGLDLTGSEINALGNLADGHARTVSELGTAVGSRPTTLTGILDRLERRGLISRGQRAGDRRAVVIALTPAGARTAAVVRAKLTEIETRSLAGVDESAIAGFHMVASALTAGTQS